MCVLLCTSEQCQHIGYCQKALDETRQLIASNEGDCVELSKKSIISDFLWRYPVYVNLLIMVDLVSVSNPPVFLIPRYGNTLSP
jgi:hypothetical protein